MISFGFLFWLLWILALVFSLYSSSPNYKGWAGGSLLFFVLIGLLGVGVFGWPLHR